MRTSFFIFFMVIFIGCSENDIIDEGEKPEDPQAEIEVYYDQESTSSRKPDAGAKVYLYYNINMEAGASINCFSGEDHTP